MIHSFTTTSIFTVPAAMSKCFPGSMQCLFQDGRRGQTSQKDEIEKGLYTKCKRNRCLRCISRIQEDLAKTTVLKPSCLSTNSRAFDLSVLSVPKAVFYEHAKACHQCMVHTSSAFSPTFVSSCVGNLVVASYILEYAWYAGQMPPSPKSALTTMLLTAPGTCTVDGFLHGATSSKYRERQYRTNTILQQLQAQTLLKEPILQFSIKH